MLHVVAKLSDSLLHAVPMTFDVGLQKGKVAVRVTYMTAEH
jgi:hypothetical protein